MYKYLLLIVSLVFIPNAYAQQAPKDTVHGYVAVGVFGTPEYEGSEDYQAVPLVAAKVNYNQYYIQTKGLGVAANISPADNFEFGPVVKFNMGRDDSVDNAAVSRLREIDSTLEAGAFVKVPFKGVLNDRDALSLNADIVADTGDEHGGMLLSFGPSYGYAVSRQLYLSTSVSATYADDNYMEAFYSIDANNSARSGLSTYDAEGGVKDIGIGMTANYQFTERWGVIGLVNYKQLIGDAEDSPVVTQGGDDTQISAGVGVSYRF